MDNLDQWIGFIIFFFAIVAPILKAIFSKKKQTSPSPASTEETKEFDWFPKEEEEKEEDDFDFEEEEEEKPRTQIPARVEAPVITQRTPEPTPPPSPIPAVVFAQEAIPIEQAADDVIAETRELAAEAESVSTLRTELPSFQSMRKEEVEEAAIPKARPRTFQELSAIEGAIVLGSSLDRPFALRDY